MSAEHSLCEFLRRWVARFMLAFDEVVPMGWFAMTPADRRWWIERAK